jgi:hypothetical protein
MTLMAFVVRSQSNHIPSISIESGAVVSTGKHAPFWFYSNQYGKISTKNNSIYLLPSIYRDFKNDSKIDYSYNISPLLRYDGSGKFYMHQWYGEVKFHFVHFTAGAKEEFYGNQDSTLSTGFLLWSKNARPMPKLTIGVPNYTPVPFTWKLLEFKGGISHGWFDDNEYNKNVWLHHKYFYLRLGGKWPVHISYGLHHFAQWGGTNYDPYEELPHDWKAFKSVFKGGGGGDYETNPNVPWTEWANRIGNHIGSRNFGLEADFSKTKISLYWQNIFEDGSGKAYRNIKDGLFGLSIRSRDKDNLISGFVYEFFNSTDQSGPSDLPTEEFTKGGGNDNYFNHGIYLNGWTYNRRIIGTPFITSPEIMHNNPDFLQSIYLVNNKIKAHHFGLEGSMKKISFKLLYTYSLNYGTNYFPISPKQTQHYFLIHATLLPNLPWNSNITCALGADLGKLYGNGLGAMVSIRKHF